MICLTTSVGTRHVGSRMKCLTAAWTKKNQPLLCRSTSSTNHCNLKHSERLCHISLIGELRNCLCPPNNNNSTTFIRSYSTSTQQPTYSSKCLLGERDRFNAVMVDLTHEGNQQFIADNGYFGNILADSTSKWQKDGTIAIWIRVPIAHSRLIPVAASHGFSLHHTEGNHIYLSRWLLDCPSRLPAYANHQIGVSGFVLNEEKEEVLMIQDKHRIVRWKFPGGLSNFGEDIPDTVVREVWEETGIKTDFQSVLCFRQQHNMPWAFGISDIYVVCRLRPLNFDLNICKDELVDAKWTKVNELLKDPNHTHLTVRVARLIQHGLKYGFDSVDISMEELPSVYKNTTYKLFHKPLPPSL
ncbi:nucleoside diphosphate-linked moiety X motif 6-like [Amphiura filiformis]|uniref:nucleoside diphosphate-linked moiety X motif 6-like n=1 Tax=Amphiura filiformis TaxID=82378 RepID=UPI003B21687E